jgi:hypothetical protein
MKAALLVITNEALRGSVAAVLARFGFVVVDANAKLPAGAVLVTTTADCSPTRARDFSAAGICVIVLSSVERADEHRKYDEAGVAAYVPMSEPVSRLIQLLSSSTLDESGRPLPIC